MHQSVAIPIETKCNVPSPFIGTAIVLARFRACHYRSAAACAFQDQMTSTQPAYPKWDPYLKGKWRGNSQALE